MGYLLAVQTTRVLKRRVAAASAVVLAVMVVGCGSDDSPDDSVVDVNTTVAPIDGGPSVSLQEGSNMPSDGSSSSEPPSTDVDPNKEGNGLDSNGEETIFDTSAP